ncbi:uncharacterized protein LOC115994029 [Quercus lobata]|uniref:Uncharacterized protein n=1 Tax=Quercus lobata TaxID=97700 RepID=A0A7N2LYE4_QUELO|nr:uncharacterized protein LOC115994029 [Quercus lobata]
MAFAYIVKRPLRFLVCVGIGTFLAYRFPEGPIPYLEPFIKREERIYLSMADWEFDKINDIIRKKGKAAKSMTVGELAEEIRDFGGIWEELAKSKENQGANQKKKD